MSCVSASPYALHIAVLDRTQHWLFRAQPRATRSTDPATPPRFACKTFMVSSVPKKKAQRRILETLRNEIDLLRSLDHPNIVRAYESYEVGQDLHLVMELCRGGGEC